MIEVVQDNVKKSFAGLGIKIEESPEIFERLVELAQSQESHFYDATEIAAMIDNLWPKLDLKGITKEEMELCSLLHDIGKSGPAEAPVEVRSAVEKIFCYKPLKVNNVNKDMSMAEFLEKSGIVEPELVGTILKEKLGINLEQEKIGEFWDRHSQWTYEILNKLLAVGNKEQIIEIASAHHLIDDQNPNGLPSENNSPDEKFLEFMDKYQALTLIDKYQALRARSGFSHNQAITSLKQLVDQNQKEMDETIRSSYERIIDVLAGSENELNEARQTANHNFKNSK
jgi:hypothetical protein